MSTVKLGINGFGRIGRFVFRSTYIANKGKAKVTAINDPFMELDYLEYLLKYDSVHGRFQLNVIAKENAIIINNSITIPVFNCKEANLIPWASCNVEVVAECSGVNLTQEKCQSPFQRGVR